MEERTYPELVGRRSRARLVVLDVPPHLGTRESPLRAADPEERGHSLEDALLGRNPGV